MKLTVLVDNNTLIDRYLLAEPGVSYFIETEGKKVLFDSGYSDAFLINAQKLGINLLDVDTVVLSHGHLDHTWGLVPLVRLYTEAKIEKHPYKKPELIAHPDVFLPRFAQGLSIGSLLGEEQLTVFFDIKLSAAPVQITPRLTFLGEIERVNEFEAKKPLGKVLENGVKKDDYLIDDTALVYRAPDGLVVITGCSHSGICNIIEQAKRLTGDSRILDVIGGFHLLKPTPLQLEGTLACMRSLQPKAVHACHCTGMAAKFALSRVVNMKEAGSGLAVEYS